MKRIADALALNMENGNAEKIVSSSRCQVRLKLEYSLVQYSRFIGWNYEAEEVLNERRKALEGKVDDRVLVYVYVFNDCKINIFSMGPINQDLPAHLIPPHDEMIEYILDKCGISRDELQRVLPLKELVTQKSFLLFNQGKIDIQFLPKELSEEFDTDASRSRWCVVL